MTAIPPRLCSSFNPADAERVRERLARAGLLVEPSTPRPRPDRAAVEAAGARAASGTPLAEIVSLGRR